MLPSLARLTLDTDADKRDLDEAGGGDDAPDVKKAKKPVLSRTPLPLENAKPAASEVVKTALTPTGCSVPNGLTDAHNQYAAVGYKDGSIVAYKRDKTTNAFEFHTIIPADSDAVAKRFNLDFLKVGYIPADGTAEGAHWILAVYNNASPIPLDETGGFFDTLKFKATYTDVGAERAEFFSRGKAEFAQHYSAQLEAINALHDFVMVSYVIYDKDGAGWKREEVATTAFLPLDENNGFWFGGVAGTVTCVSKASRGSHVAIGFSSGHWRIYARVRSRNYLYKFVNDPDGLLSPIYDEYSVFSTSTDKPPTGWKTYMQQQWMGGKDLDKQPAKGGCRVIGISDDDDHRFDADGLVSVVYDKQPAGLYRYLWTDWSQWPLKASKPKYIKFDDDFVESSFISGVGNKTLVVANLRKVADENGTSVKWVAENVNLTANNNVTLMLPGYDITAMCVQSGTVDAGRFVLGGPTGQLTTWAGFKKLQTGFLGYKKLETNAPITSLTANVPTKHEYLPRKEKNEVIAMTPYDIHVVTTLDGV